MSGEISGKIRCSLCGREVEENEIYGFYPEDSSYICKECFAGNKKEIEEKEEVKK